MREARDAVPAWIMPLDVVLETLAPVRDSFDVVIVDEASQASLEDLFLLWLAPRVIVVGDDKQCAPSQVRLGELEPIFGKLSSYLPELPGYLRDAYTPKSSLFDLLAHPVRRGDPAARALPVHAGDHRVLVAAVLRRRTVGAAAPVRRRPAAAAALGPGRGGAPPRAPRPGCATRSRPRPSSRQIEACLADPAYDGQDLRRGGAAGHRSGPAAAPDAARARRAEGVGAAPAAGRHAARLPGRRARRHLRVAGRSPRSARRVTGTEWQRRFNVAASRAKDQLWLFHSVGPDQLSSRPSLVATVLCAQSAAGARRGGALRMWRPDEPHPAFRSLFDQRVFCYIHDRGFHVTPRVEVNGRAIDLVVTGAKGRLAVECDGATGRAARSSARPTSTGSGS